MATVLTFRPRPLRQLADSATPPVRPYAGRQSRIRGSGAIPLQRRTLLGDFANGRTDAEAAIEMAAVFSDLAAAGRAHSTLHRVLTYSGNFAECPPPSVGYPPIRPISH